MNDIIEDCPVCENHTLVWNCMACECRHCGWYPITIPFDEDDYKEAKLKYDSLHKPVLNFKKHWWRN